MSGFIGVRLRQAQEAYRRALEDVESAFVDEAWDDLDRDWKHMASHTVGVTHMYTCYPNRAFVSSVIRNVYSLPGHSHGAVSLTDQEARKAWLWRARLDDGTCVLFSLDARDRPTGFTAFVFFLTNAEGCSDAIANPGLDEMHQPLPCRDWPWSAAPEDVCQTYTHAVVVPARRMASSDDGELQTLLHTVDTRALRSLAQKMCEWACTWPTRMSVKMRVCKLSDVWQRNPVLPRLVNEVRFASV